jgi:hypothetical protein
VTRHRSQDNSAAQRHLLRRPVRGFPLFQLCALRRLQLDRQTFIRHDWDHTKSWERVKLFMGHYTSCPLADNSEIAGMEAEAAGREVHGKGVILNVLTSSFDLGRPAEASSRSEANRAKIEREDTSRLVEGMQ